MARIRSIKPEFPQSETIGRLSRDARLLFVQLWTIVDDDGRARAASRMLASLLYPYDDDAPGLIDSWLGELEREQCLIRYDVDGSRYLQLTNWLKHQKIDHPSKSKIPSIPETFAKPREDSRKLAPDLGPRIGKDRSSPNGEPAPSGALPKSSIPVRPDTAAYQRGKELLGAKLGGKVVKALIAHSEDIDDVNTALKRIEGSADPPAYAASILRNYEQPESTDDWIT